MIYPSPRKTDIVAEGAGWLAWSRKASGQKVIAIEHGNGSVSSIELEFASNLLAKFPDRAADISAAGDAFL